MIISKYYFEPDIFAEGLTVLNDKLYCLSWKNPLLFEFDLDLNIIKSEQLLNIKEGWGLTTDNINFIITDGSEIIHIIEPNDLSIKKLIKTTQTNLNAISYYDNHIYSNIWHTNQIIKICIQTGTIIQRWDLSNIFIPIPYIFNYSNNNFIIDDYSSNQNVLNGITHYIDDLFLITGKNWNRIYLIQFFNFI